MSDTRLARLFIGALRREARRRALDDAIERGVFAMRPPVPLAGTVWMPSPCPDLPEAWAALRTGRLVGEDSTDAEWREAGEDITFDAVLIREKSETHPTGASRKAAGKNKNSRAARTGASPSAGSSDQRSGPPLAEREAMVRVARDRALPVAPSRVAAVLLLAEAVHTSPLGLAGVLAVLRRSTPVVGIVAAIAGERHLLEMILFTGVLPRLGLVPIKPSSARVLARSGTRREVAVIADRQARSARWGRDEEAEIEAERLRELAEALNSGRPVFALVRTPDDLPPRFAEIADLVLHAGPLTPHVVAQVIAVVHGEALPDDASPQPLSLDPELCGALTLADLDLAVRSGRPREDIASDLMRYGEANAAAAKEKAAREAVDKSGKAGRPGGKPFNKNGSGSELVQPSSDPAAPHLDRLAGYGAAVAWANALGSDLAAWREKKIAWADLSSKILLHGAPGTGKTLFARALSNTLQVPLLVSSVSTWLESGHLGDVLRRMRAAFAEAEANAPSVLFLDELDGIGSREAMSGREYDDYWIAVINALLTLLDGAARSEGVVIVGATNRPGAIDPAILRSGRLETHIRVDKPDTAALAGILRVQIGSDLGSVAASAPAQAPNIAKAEQVGAPTPDQPAKSAATPTPRSRKESGDEDADNPAHEEARP